MNNISLKGILLNHYRAFIGQSLPEESPFEGTILENLTFGDPDISMEQVYWALEQTGLLPFVQEQPKGIKTMLYPEGLQIPYTIGKKIVLARSIIHKPRLLILKDPLDQLDKEESRRIMKFLTNPDNGWSLIVVSTNPDWAECCGQILQMEEGRIVNKR